MLISKISNTNFTAKKIKSKSLEEIQLLRKRRVAQINTYFRNPKNIEIIEENKRHSERVSAWVRENSGVKSEVLNQPFGPIGGLWPHERL